MTAATLRDDNHPRLHPEGHVESWFLRANHPTEPRALWLKATALVPDDGEAVAEAWCCTFDGVAGRSAGGRDAVPLDTACFDDQALAIAGSTLRLGHEGAARGALHDERGSWAWDLAWRVVDGPVGRPLCLFPTRRFLRWRRFPRFKLVTPAPVLRFDGEITWDDERIDVDGWLGMQGHNWGREHAHRYAWGQVVFTDADGAPHCMAEGYSGRVRLAGPLRTPLLSALVVRRGDRAWRFDRTVDRWNQEARIGDLAWRARLRGPGGEAVLAMEARPEHAVCLGYRNPGGSMAYCLNSKIARATLRVNPVNGEGFECTTEHGGALELLQPEPDPRFPDPI